MINELEYNMITIKNDYKKGRCVIATKDIAKDTLIEKNHCIVYKHIDDNKLYSSPNINDWSMFYSKTHDCIALGNINLLNHSKDSNVYINTNYKNKTKYMYARRFIKAGEELVVDYDVPLWFKEC